MTPEGVIAGQKARPHVGGTRGRGRPPHLLGIFGRGGRRWPARAEAPSSQGRSSYLCNRWIGLSSATPTKSRATTGSTIKRPERRATPERGARRATGRDRQIARWGKSG